VAGEGWRRTGKRKGMPFYGELEEELEKERYGIDD